jgi:hypothetical protein
MKYLREVPCGMRTLREGACTHPACAMKVRADAHGDDRLSQKPSGFQSHAPANERMGRDARNATPRIDVETEASCLESHGRQVAADM